ncbi:MAG: amino acid adenylation domain-containing protein, partial [Lachnospiraceae bacterium]|nr:amino acid adenylation domain-containing protein [Lachnospiraceae bacterium]
MSEYRMDMNNYYLERVRAALKKFAGNTALAFLDRIYTYEELDSVTGRLAAYLKAEGIGAGDIVSVLILRNEYLTIAPLGVLRAGATYQPLDPSHPPKRIRSMIENAGSPLVIVEKACEHLLDGISFGKNRKKLYLEDIPFLPSAEEAPWGEARPEDDFVILYTSGSTGEPKGIEITHRNIASLLDWFIDYYSVDETCRVGQHSSFVFDPAIVESMLPLAAGASIYIIPQELRADIFLLDQFYHENRITYASLTTQLGRQFVMHGKGQTLKHLVVGGEALVSVSPPKHYILHNGYGPAEGTQQITIFPVQKDYPGKVPIGKALPEVEIYLLDDDGKQVKDGEAGELCFAGPHVTKGYLNRPDLTEKVFTNNPFSKKPEYQRMYHTGDLVRKGDNGNFEYLGRKDRQVKIRGFRIEPAEIESVLNAFPGIDDAVVVPKSLGSETLLAAYYLSKEPVDERLLADFILAQKPSYMLPAFFIQMDEFPLTVNGKVDYEALPRPAREMKDDFEAPASRTEKELAALYEEILGIEPIGRQDDFLRLGGTSLSSARLMYGIYDAFSCRISIRDIMEAPVLWELAERIDQKCSTQDGESAVFAQKMLPFSGEYEVSYAQERMYTAQEMLGADDPTYLLQLFICTEGEFDRKKTEAVLRTLFIRHESLRTEFHMTGVGLRQRILSPTEEWVREAIARTEGRELFPGFSMGEAPLFAWHFSKKKLTFQWHHSISDGRSGILFAEEFGALYNEKTLPALPVHQKEYAAYERKCMQSVLYQRRMEGWKQLFAPFIGAEEAHLPLDGRFAPGGERRACHVKSVLSKQLSEQIRAFCCEKQMTPYMLLLAAYVILLHQYTRTDSLILGTVMDGRQEPGTKNLQGMFVNTVPLFLSVEEDAILSDFFGQLMQTVL